MQGLQVVSDTIAKNSHETHGGIWRKTNVSQRTCQASTGESEGSTRVSKDAFRKEEPFLSAQVCRYGVTDI